MRKSSGEWVGRDRVMIPGVPGGSVLMGAVIMPARGVECKATSSLCMRNVSGLEVGPTWMVIMDLWRDLGEVSDEFRMKLSQRGRERYRREGSLLEVGGDRGERFLLRGRAIPLCRTIEAV